eukprot:14153824-Alexandrium_andersonii.AAC.1
MSSPWPAATLRSRKACRRAPAWRSAKSSAAGAVRSWLRIAAPAALQWCPKGSATPHEAVAAVAPTSAAPPSVASHKGLQQSGLPC